MSSDSGSGGHLTPASPPASTRMRMGCSAEKGIGPAPNSC